jgi:hypothetical protein
LAKDVDISVAAMAVSREMKWKCIYNCLRDLRDNEKERVAVVICSPVAGSDCMVLERY